MFSSTEKKTVKLISNDGQAFSIEIEAAKKANVIAKLIETLALENQTVGLEIPMPNLGSTELKKVIDYLEYHNRDTASLFEYRSSLQNNRLSAFDKSFINTSNELLLDIYNAANYLDIEFLRELIAWAIAESIKGKKSLDINNYWLIDGDFNADDLHEIQKEFSWANQM